MERRIVAQMLTCMDDLSAQPEPSQAPAAEGDASPAPEDLAKMHKHVIVIGERPRNNTPSMCSCAKPLLSLTPACLSAKVSL